MILLDNLCEKRDGKNLEAVRLGERENEEKRKERGREGDKRQREKQRERESERTPANPK